MKKNIDVKELDKMATELQKKLDIETDKQIDNYYKDELKKVVSKFIINDKKTNYK